MEAARIALYAGSAAVVAAIIGGAATWRVSPRVELDADISGVELAIGSEAPTDPALPALSASEVSLDFVKSLSVPNERLPADVRSNASPNTLVATSRVDAAYGTIHLHSMAANQPVTTQPIRLQAGGRMRIDWQLGVPPSGRLSVLLTKIAEPVFIATPGAFSVEATPPSTLKWGSAGGGTQLRINPATRSPAIQIMPAQSLLVSLTDIDGSVLPSLLSDRTRFSRVAFQVPDAVDGNLRSTLVKAATLRYPALPDFRPALGSSGDLLVLESDGQLRFTQINATKEGLKLTLVGSANRVVHGSVDLRPTLLDVVWAHKILVMLVTAVFTLIGGLTKLLDLREKLTKFFSKPKEYRD